MQLIKPDYSSLYRSWRNSVGQWWSVCVLFVVMGVSYSWGLGNNRFGNSFYAGAEQAGARSWKAFFYGASDFQSTITVDKPPLSLWPSSVAIRFFGLNSWSIFLPQVVMALMTAWVIYVLVRRNFCHLSAWLAVFVFASCPLVFIMFRFNNPDAMMLLWITVAVYTLSRAVEVSDGVSSRFPFWLWNVFTGVVMGLSFLTKQLEGLMTVPALGLGVLLCVKVKKQKFSALFYNLFGLIVGGGWWTAIVELVPPSQRPFIGGSPTNDFLQLTFVYNGIDRFSNNLSERLMEIFSKVDFPDQEGDAFNLSHSHPGVTRFLWSFEATQIGLLSALTFVGIIVGFWWLYRWNKGTVGQKVIYVIMSFWFVFLWLTFSFMGERFHSYYALILVTPMAVVCGCVLSFFWRMRNQWWVKRIVLLVIILETITAVLTACNGDDLTPVCIPWIIGVMGVVSFVIAVQMMWKTTYAYTASAKNPWIIATSLGLMFLTFLPSLYYLGSSYPRSIAVTTYVAGPGFKVYAFPAYKNENKWGENFRHAVEKYVLHDAQKYAWIVGIINAKTAVNPYILQLDTGYSVLPIGGYFGIDPCPTLDRLKSIIQHHQMHYYIIAKMHGDKSEDNRATYGPIISLKYVEPKIYNYITQNFPHHDITQYFPMEKANVTEQIYDLTKPITQ